MIVAIIASQLISLACLSVKKLVWNLVKDDNSVLSVVDWLTLLTIKSASIKQF